MHSGFEGWLVLDSGQLCQEAVLGDLQCPQLGSLWTGNTGGLWLTDFFLSCAAQRSAQELPLVEKQSTDSYPVIGGKKMVLSGHNFLQDSKVIFVEKAPGTFFKTGHLSFLLVGIGFWLLRDRQA